MAVDDWRHYLQQQSAQFVILTDQKSLTHLDDQRLSTAWQHKASTKLISYQIIYKKGCDMVADALSRIHTTDDYDISAISVLKPLCVRYMCLYIS